MPMTAKQMMKLLEKNGFIKQEGGNHTIFYNPITKKKNSSSSPCERFGQGFRTTNT